MPRHFGTHRFDGLKVGQQPLQATLDGYRSATREPLTFNVDYNLASAIRTPAVVFSRQIEIDGYLRAAGATAFQYLQDVWDALPTDIMHNVTINLAAGIHRPRNPENAGTFGWTFSNRVITATTLHITGAGSGSFITVVASQAITSTQAASNDPWVDVSPATPYAGLNLKGYKVVLSTGQIATIHDHTASRLFLLEALSPTGPTTVIVARPGTELRNSYNDTTAAKTGGGIQINNPYLGRSIHIENIELSQFNTGFGISTSSGGLRCTNVLMDFARQKDTFGLTFVNARGWQSSDGVLTLLNSSVRSDRYAAVPSANVNSPLFISGDTSTFIQRLFLNTSNNHVVFQGTRGGFISLSNSVIDGYYGLAVEDKAMFLTQNSGTGKRMTIRNCTLSPGIVFNSGGGMPQAQLQIVFFENIVGQPCVRIGNGCIVDQTQLGGGFQNGLVSNSDVGIEVLSTTTKSTTILDSSTNVSGTAGQVRFAGTTETYASIQSDGPFIDMLGNYISKL